MKTAYHSVGVYRTSRTRVLWNVEYAILLEAAKVRKNAMAKAKVTLNFFKEHNKQR